MIPERKKYYFEMIKNDRLFSVVIENRFAALITFYITNNEHEYDNVDPWEVLDDNPNGKFCYIAQMLTDSKPENSNLSFCTLKNFITYIRSKFPNVKYIFWRRWNKNSKTVKVYKKEL